MISEIQDIMRNKGYSQLAIDNMELYFRDGEVTDNIKHTTARLYNEAKDTYRIMEFQFNDDIDTRAVLVSCKFYEN